MKYNKHQEIRIDIHKVESQQSVEKIHCRSINQTCSKSKMNVLCMNK